MSSSTFRNRNCNFKKWNFLNVIDSLCWVTLPNLVALLWTVSTCVADKQICRQIYDVVLQIRVLRYERCLNRKQKANKIITTRGSFSYVDHPAQSLRTYLPVLCTGRLINCHGNGHRAAASRIIAHTGGHFFNRPNVMNWLSLVWPLN